VEDSVSDKKEDGRLLSRRKQVTEALDNTRTEREHACLHRDYFDDIQWTAAEVATLQARGQPIITDNKIKDKVEYMEGIERKTRSDPKAYPRTPKHGEDADVATDAIRYVFDANRFPMIKSAVFQNLLIEGLGAIEVIPDKDDSKKIILRKVRWDRFYRDPYSMEPDCSDARYLGIITWMDQDSALERWESKKNVIEITANSEASKSNDDTSDDAPRWIDSRRKRVQVFEHYERRKGSIYRSVFVWGGELEEEKECPYEDEDGKREWPIVVASAYVSRDGQRYGLVKRYVSLQDEVNKRRSKSLHLLNSKLLIAEKGAFQDGEDGRNGIDQARDQIHKPDGVLEPNPGFKVEVQNNLDLSAGHFQLLQQAELALSATGPNAALLGQSGAISGRAKELDQQGGSVQIGVLFDSIRDWQLRVARAVWNRIRQYWDEEMMIRVTDDEFGLKFVSINKRLTNGEVAAKQMAEQMQGQPPEALQQALAQLAADPLAQEMAVDERGYPVMENDVANLDVDIIIDESPDVITLQSEEFEKLANLAGTGQVPIPPDALIEASNLRSATKKRILEILKPENDPMAQQQAKFAEMMAQLDGMLKEATVRKTEAEATLKEAQAVQTQAETATGLADSMEPTAPANSPGSAPAAAARESRPAS
jgi:hypothetical protein